MVRRRKSRISRIRSYPRRRYRAFRRGKAPIPLLPTLGFTAPLLAVAPYNGTWSSPIEAIKAGNIPVAMQSLIVNLTGLGVPMAGTGHTTGAILYDLPKLLNPMDFTHAGALKGLILGSIASKLLTKFGVNRQFQRLPFIGKYVKL